MRNKIKTFLTILLASFFSVLIYFFNEIVWAYRPFESGVFTTGRLIFFIFFFSIFIPMAVIAKKFNYEYYWVFPIMGVNFFALSDFVGRPNNYLLYLLIPIFNLFIIIILLIDFLKKIERHPAKVVLLIIPVISNFYLICLAFKIKNENFISKVSEAIIWILFIPTVVFLFYCYIGKPLIEYRACIKDCESKVYLLWDDYIKEDCKSRCEINYIRTIE
jgi:hypothetical protein